MYYRTPVPTRANPDFVSTSVNSPVSVDVLLNDWNANTTSRADLSIVSFQNPSERGGTVTNLGGGVLRYTPPAGFRGDDVFRYYVSDPSGHFKSLSGVRVLVVDPNNPLVAHYPFDETTGISALDISGGGRKGTLTGNGSFATDRVPGVGGVGGALHLSGYAGTWDGSPRLTFGNPNPWTTLDPPDRIASYSYDAMDRSQSVSFWYKPDKLPVTGNFDSTHEFHMLYGKHNVYQSGFGDGGGIVIGINNNTLFAVVQMYGPHGNPVTVDSGITPQPGMWYHIVGEIDRKYQQVHLYVNGVKYSSAAGALPAGQFVIGSICANLGGQNQGSHTMYAAPAGAYDDLRIYTKALTSTEVTGLYEAPGMLPANLPAPTVGQTGVTPLPLLSWVAGRPRYQHDVYFGTDAAAVAAASVSTPGIYLGRTSDTSRQLTSPLDLARTYFWRIDEVDGSTIGKGAVWQFTTVPPSPACDLLSFNWGGNVGVINGTNVTLVVPYGTNLTTLNPTCTVSSLATVSPASGSTVDFSNSATVPVPYTVTAQDQSTKVYQVTVTKVPPATDILTFTLGSTAGNISGTNVTLVVPYATDVTALAPIYTVSQYATGDPAYPSGTARNFTTPKTYTIPAQDGSTSKTYTVTVYQMARPGTIATVPPGLQEGDKYRLVFVTSTQTYSGGSSHGPNPPWFTSAADYNAFATSAATAVPALASLGTTWKAVVSSSYPAFDARDNTGTNPSTTGVPIYNLAGVCVANNNADLWDATIQNPINITELGGTPPASPFDGKLHVWTGTSQNGISAYGQGLIWQDGGWISNGLASSTDGGWVSGNFENAIHGNLQPIYAMSGILTAPPSPSLCDMLTFKWGASIGVITGTDISLTVPDGTDMTTLNPTCTVSFGATVSPASGSARNFSSPVSYTVTSQNGSAAKTYTVRVALAAPDPIVTVPPGLNPGDHYRLVFVTSTETYSGGADQSALTPPGFTTVAQFNDFAASAATAVPALAALGTTWKAVISATAPTWPDRSASVDAKTNTATDPTVNAATSVPIYQLGGLRVADGYADLWDGTIQNPINVNELGRGPVAQRGGFFRVWTGANSSGGNGGGDQSLIAQNGGFINNGLANATNSGWVSGNYDNAIHGDMQPIYAISGILMVPHPSNNYAAWAAANSANTDPAADSNHNGIPNGVEHFMGATAANPAMLPPLANTTGTWTWTIPYDPAAAASYYFQVSDNLQSWTPLPPGNPAVAVLTSPDRVRLTLPSGMRFCRLVVATP